MLALQDEAHLVFSTLNSSGLPCMDHTTPFEVLVVDEAAQSVEVSTIIPLRSERLWFFATSLFSFSFFLFILLPVYIIIKTKYGW